MRVNERVKIVSLPVVRPVRIVWITGEKQDFESIDEALYGIQRRINSLEYSLYFGEFITWTTLTGEQSKYDELQILREEVEQMLEWQALEKHQAEVDQYMANYGRCI